MNETNIDTSIIKEETFLEVTVGNFADCVENIIYKYQKYVDILYIDIPNLYSDLKKNTSTETQKILGFISTEQENLLIMKGVMTLVESVNLLIRKYDGLREKIQSAEDMRYYISPQAYDYILKVINNLDINILKFNVYDGKFKNQSSNFMMYMNEKMNYYKSFQFVSDKSTVYSNDSILLLLDNICMVIINTLNQLKELSESSTDINTTFGIVRIAIDVLVCAFEMTRTISVDS